MSTHPDSYQRRRFTEAEYSRMLDTGILSPDEGSILRGGFVLVPATRNRQIGPNQDPGPIDALDPADAALAEPPTVSRILREVSEIMNALNTEIQEDYAARKFTVGEYYRMGEVGILSSDERTELLDGEIIVMPPMRKQHLGPMTILDYGFKLNINMEHAVAVSQVPVLLDSECAPQPDVMLVKPGEFFRTDNIPTASDVLLVVEASYSSLDYDRDRKMPAYARNGIPEYWLADANERTVDIHTDPQDGIYTNVRTVGMDGTLSPTAFPDVVIAVRDIFRW